MTSTAHQVFDFIAEAVEEALVDDGDDPASRRLGYTFSFPVHQTGIAAGTLINWTKGFTATEVEGRDVVVLLDEALARRNTEIRTTALINDTVGTLMAGAYELGADAKCHVGLILGTGTNRLSRLLQEVVVF